MKPGELAGTTMRHLLVGEAFHGRQTSPASSNEGSETIEAASHRRFGALQPIHSDVLAAVKQLVLALEAHPEDRAELVCRPGDSRAKSLELFKDRVGRGGPDEWSSVLVVGRYELLDSGDQLLDAGKASTSNRSLRDDPKPALHLIQP